MRELVDEALAVELGGVAIILVTVLIKGAFYKLTEASGRSMAKMREIDSDGIVATLREAAKQLRITSYKVCYTKLLRPRRRTARAAASAERRRALLAGSPPPARAAIVISLIV